MSTPAKSMDAIMALCKRRGFVYQASEIYGGLNGFWDYGPLGAQLKKNLREAWWQDMILRPAWGRQGPKAQGVRCVPVETRIIQHPKVWEASGHVGGFNDPMIDDKETKGRFRADHLRGLYPNPGLSQAGDQTVRFVASIANPGINILPIATVVAASEGEAVAMLKDDRKLQKTLGIGEIKHLVRNTHVSDMWDAEIVFKGTAIACTLRAVPMEQLKTNSSQIPSPFTGKKGSLTEPRQFNLMFKTYVGATATEDDVAYLRPETAQGIFVQFKNVVDTTRIKVPFGIGNTGTSFRNEVTPRNFTFRSREFDQAELEFFCHPDESMEWFEFWRKFRMDWWESLGLAGENLRLYDTPKKDLAHYAFAGSDVEYRFPFTAPGFGELEGIAHRGDFDLKQHQDHSKVKLEYNDTERGELLPNGSRRGEKYLPHCIEPAAGLDRGVLALLCEAYTRDESRASPEFLKLHPRLAPVKAAVFPLVAKEGMPEIAEKLHKELSEKFWRLGAIEFDEKQSIGKRYARMDEAGCPFCFTIDGETLKDQTVTVRDRDTGTQQRIGLGGVADFLAQKLGV